MTKQIRVAACGTAMFDTVCAGLTKEPAAGEVEYVDVPVGDNAAGHPIDVAICLAKLGFNSRKISVVASVGLDFAGNIIRRELQKYGINTRWLKQDGRFPKTGRNLVSVVGREDRRFRLYPGANEDLDPEFVTSALKEIRPDILSIRPGYSGMDLSVDRILAMASQSCIVLLDLMKPKPKEKDGKDRLSAIRSALSYAHIVHCNQKEALLITGERDLEDAIQYFLRRGVELVFVTFGGAGARVITRRGLDVAQPPYDNVSVIDPTGCGDAFCAGVIRYLQDKLNILDQLAGNADLLTDILRFAQAVGASAAEGVGTTAGVSLSRVQEFLQKQGMTIGSRTQIRTLPA